MKIYSLVKSTILEKLPDAEVIVLDPMRDQTHLEAIVISDHFEEMKPIDRHRAVLLALKPALTTSLHAIGLKLFTKEEWEKKKGELEEKIQDGEVSFD